MIGDGYPPAPTPPWIRPSRPPLLEQLAAVAALFANPGPTPTGGTTHDLGEPVMPSPATDRHHPDVFTFALTPSNAAAPAGQLPVAPGRRSLRRRPQPPGPLGRLIARLAGTRA